MLEAGKSTVVQVEPARSQCGWKAAWATGGWWAHSAERKWQCGVGSSVRGPLVNNKAGRNARARWNPVAQAHAIQVVSNQLKRTR